MKGMGYAVASIPPILKDLRDRISQRAFDFILGGVFRVEEDILPADETRASPYTDLTQKLGDRLTDYEMVEDLIERGMLAENEDGTLYIQLK